MFKRNLLAITLFCTLLTFASCTIDNQKETIIINDLSEMTSLEVDAAEDETGATGQQPVAGADWLSLSSQFSDSWQAAATNDLIGLPSPPVFIQTQEPSGEPYEIIAIFSKKSSAYNTALNSILTLFAGRGVEANLLVLNGENDARLISSAYLFAEGEKPDLILSFGSKATAWIHDHDTKSDTPVLSVTSKDPVLMGQVDDYESGSGTHIAYTSLNIPIELQLSYLKQFRPELKVIGILYAEKNSSAVVTQVEPLVAAAEADGIEIVYFNVLDQKNAQTELEMMMPSRITQMQAQDPENAQSLLWITGSTSVFNEIETINRYAAGIPVLSVVTNVTQEGPDSAMMSIGVSFESNALMAAIYAERILNGEAAGELPVGVVSPPDIAINFSKAAESGVDIPFTFFESANFVYDAQGAQVRAYGQ